MELLRSPALLIANPGARSGGRHAEAAAEAARKAGADLTIAWSDSPGDAARIASSRGADYAAVLSLGGDGTAVEVIESMRGRQTPVGVLAGGTGNLVARSLGVPLDIRRAVPLLLGGEEALVDLGVLNDRWNFLFTLGIGMDAEMIANSAARAKRRLGILAYFLAAAPVVLRRRTFRAMIEVDARSLEIDASSIMIANFGSVLNDLFQLGPEIEVDDGLLDLCVFSPEGLFDSIAIAWRLLRKDFRPRRGMRYVRGSIFRIDCDPPQRVQTDGELRCATPIEVRVDPRAARLLKPRLAV